MKHKHINFKDDPIVKLLKYLLTGSIKVVMLGVVIIFFLNISIKMKEISC